MGKVYTIREFSEACKFAAQVYKRQIDKETAIVKLVGVGINETSANDFIVIYKNLVGGNTFLIGTSALAMRYFIREIKNEYGLKGLRSAIAALTAHIARQNSPMHQMKELLVDLEKELNE